MQRTEIPAMTPDQQRKADDLRARIATLEAAKCYASAQVLRVKLERLTRGDVR